MINAHSPVTWLSQSFECLKDKGYVEFITTSVQNLFLRNGLKANEQEVEDMVLKYIWNHKLMYSNVQNPSWLIIVGDTQLSVPVGMDWYQHWQ